MKLKITIGHPGLKIRAWPGILIAWATSGEATSDWKIRTVGLTIVGNHGH